MKVLCGIDPGMTGFCVSVFTTRTLKDFLFISTSSKCEMQDRISFIVRVLLVFLKAHKIKTAVLEIPIHKVNAHAFFMQSCLYQAILCHLTIAGIRVTSVRPTQAKMWLEKGTISKDRVYEIMQEKFNIDSVLPDGLTKKEREGLMDSLMIGMWEQNLGRFRFDTKRKKDAEKASTKEGQGDTDRHHD